MPSESRYRILVVEDNQADVFLIREALQAVNLEADLRVFSDGEGAIKYFEQADRDDTFICPALIILDINLPKRNGGEVLREMRKSRTCANAKVLVVTSSDSARDRDEVAKLGANGYFRKPSDYASFLKLGEEVKSLLK